MAARVPSRPNSVDQARYRVGWCAQHGEVGHLRQVGWAREHGNALERGVLGIHRVDRPGEVTGAQVAPNGGPYAADAVRCADDSDRLRFQQPIEMADAHRGFKESFSA